jgi:16S rRNA G1207 methylase RsmC
MKHMSAVVQQLKKERELAQNQVQRIDAALTALGSVSSNGASRTMSASARRRISLAQKARWAKQKAAQPKGMISAAGRRRIAAAQRARWAKVKASK